jgi:hypothetical protein
MDRLCIRSFCIVFLAVAAISFSTRLSNAQTPDSTSPAHPPDARPTESAGTEARPNQARPNEAAQKSADMAQPPAAPAIPANAGHMEKQTRFQIIHDLETQLVYSRTAFPMGTKGLILKSGVITPNGEEIRQALALWGPAVKPGDPAHISFVQIKPDHIHFELNGGPIRRRKWYNHIQISGANGAGVTPGGSDDPVSNPHGSYLDLYFDKYVPEMTPQQLRALLFPALDFNARNKEQAYLDTVPPKVKEAIQAHHVLVGMNSEMVVHAKGRPPKKVREKDGETDYEEWIYGEPPADVDFVRIVGDEVVRVETMKVNGVKLVRTEKEVILEPSEKDKDKEAKAEQGDRPANAPSLRRAGEDSENVPQPADSANPMPPAPPPDIPPQPGTPGPGPLVAGR